MYELALFRALQGLGAGGLMALPLAIMGDILAPRERAKYQGYFLAVFGVSSVIGPLIGGLLSGTPEILGITGWRWVFLINIPIGIAALRSSCEFLHVPHTSAGCASTGGELRRSSSPWSRCCSWPRRDASGAGAPSSSIACYVIGVLGIAAFILSRTDHGRRRAHPAQAVQDRRRSRWRRCSGVLVGFGMFGAMMTMPLYLQLVNGATPTESGFLMLPMIGGLMIASSIVSGQVIARTGKYRIFPTTRHRRSWLAGFLMVDLRSPPTSP